MKTLGTSDSIKNAQHDCSGFSADWQGREFPQYFYKGMTFIKDGERLMVESIDFQKSNWAITYKGFVFSQFTTSEKISAYFPTVKPFKIGDKPKIYFYLQKGGSDYLLFEFENGYLKSYKYIYTC